MRRIERLPVAGLVLCGLAAAPLGARAERVGVAGAANTRAAGTPRGGVPKLIEIGAQIIRDEKIETSATGSVQILFLDKTTLTVGPNSRIVIDRFVYNPATNSGSMILTLGRGVMRVVGGQATHSEGAQINTPVATVGIRGGIATISHCPVDVGARGRLILGALCDQPGTTAINHFGVLDVTGRDGTSQHVARSGFQVFVAAAGEPAPAAPVRITANQMAQINASLTSRPGQRGGAAKLPTDATGAAAGLGTANRGVGTQHAVRRNQTAAAPPRAAYQLANGVFAQSPLFGTGVQQGVTGTAAATTIAQLPPKGPAPTAYLLTTTAGAGSSVPFLTASFLTAGTAGVSPVYGYREGGPQNDANARVSHAYQSSFVLSGSGAGQSSTLAVSTQIFAADDSGKLAGRGEFRGVNRTPGVGDFKNGGYVPGLSTGSVSTTTNPGAALATVPDDATGVPNGSFQTSQNTLAFDTSTRKFVGAAVPATDLTTATGYTFDQTVKPGVAGSALGADHPGVTLNGYVGAIGQTVIVGPANGKSGPSVVGIGPAFIVTNATGSPNDVSIALSGASSRLSAQFNVRNATALGLPYEYQTAHLRFGSPDPASDATYDPSRGVYVDQTHFAANSARTYNSAASAFVETSTVNGGALQQDPSNTAILVSAATFNDTKPNLASYFPGVTFCQCDYTQWGLWSQSTSRASPAAGFSVRDQTGIAFFVAGRPAAAADVDAAAANNVQATYTGHVVAAIANGLYAPANGSLSAAGGPLNPNSPAGQYPAQYIAASPFSNIVNFATRTGTVSIPNLDGVSYSGSVNLAPGSTAFAGLLPGVALAESAGVSGNTLTLNGSFFKSATSPVGEMGGSVVITNPARNYLGSGIFAAHRP